MKRPHEKKHVLTGLVCWLLVAFAAPSVAAPTPDVAADDDAGEETLRSPDECQTLFGAALHRERNKRRRERLVESIAEESIGIVDVTHSGKWFRPYYLELNGIELLASDSTGGQGPEAVVAIDEEAGVDCPPGLYPLRQDDSLGTAAKVLEVLDDVVLVEFKGDLAYLLSPRALPPTWRMIWRSPWKIIRRYELGNTTVAGGSKAKKSRRSRAKKRRSNRRKRR